MIPQEIKDFVPFKHIVSFRPPNQTLPSLKQNRQCLLISVLVPADHNMKVKEIDKHKKSTDIQIEVAQNIGCTSHSCPSNHSGIGISSTVITPPLRKSEKKPSIPSLQMSAFLGTANILRNLRSFWGRTVWWRTKKKDCDDHKKNFRDDWHLW